MVACGHDFKDCPLRTKEHPMGFTECSQNWDCRAKYMKELKEHNTNPSYRTSHQ
jgi:hypothetical protein